MSVRSHPTVGDLIAGRFRLLAPVGSGASARVWVAEDRQLRRRVALKMLHPHLLDDATFIKRFRAEARASAALNNPNVMHVYDAPEIDPPLIVCEYLAGGSLQAMLATGARLSVSQVLEVALETAKALDYAHHEGFVHRDIKPANLLFGEDRRVRIADFGLARALASASWTEPQGMLLGTVRYASPEQARGRLVTGRSDLYSLALTMVEAVTGDVPFSREDATSMLAARCEADLFVPPALGRLVPVVESIGRLDPDSRPDAGGLVSALVEASEDLPRPKPLPLAMIDIDSLAAAESRRFAPSGIDDSDPDAGLDDLTTHVRTGRPAAAGGVDMSASTEVIDLEEGTADPVPAVGRRRRRRWPLVALAVLLAGGVAGWWFLVRTPSHRVPDLVGLDLAQAQQQVSDFGWRLDTRDTARKDGTRPNEVVSQDPGEGVQLAEDQTLRLVISLGPPLVNVPDDLARKPEEAARTELTLLGFQVSPDVARPNSEDFNAGEVISADVPGKSNGQAPKGTVVTLTVSAGPVPRTIPTGLAGQKYDAVVKILGDLRLTATRKDEFSADVAQGSVMAVSGEGTQVARDSAVEVVVSKGPELFPIPDVTGKTAIEANNILTQQGFSVSGILGPTQNPVLATDPPAGEAHPKGTSVRIIPRQ